MEAYTTQILTPRGYFWDDDDRSMKHLSYSTDFDEKTRLSQGAPTSITQILKEYILEEQSRMYQDTCSNNTYNEQNEFLTYSDSLDSWHSSSLSDYSWSDSECDTGDSMSKVDNMNNIDNTGNALNSFNEEDTYQSTYNLQDNDTSEAYDGNNDKLSKIIEDEVYKKFSYL
jgi:hypothetical protein